MLSEYSDRWLSLFVHRDQFGSIFTLLVSERCPVPEPHAGQANIPKSSKEIANRGRANGKTSRWLESKTTPVDASGTSSKTPAIRRRAPDSKMSAPCNPTKKNPEVSAQRSAKSPPTISKADMYGSLCGTAAASRQIGKPTISRRLPVSVDAMRKSVIMNNSDL